MVLSLWSLWFYRKTMSYYLSAYATIEIPELRNDQIETKRSRRKQRICQDILSLYSTWIYLSIFLHTLSIYCYGSASLYGHKFLFVFFSNQYTLQGFRDVDKGIWRSQAPFAPFAKVIVLARERYWLKAFSKKKKTTIWSVVLTF